MKIYKVLLPAICLLMSQNCLMANGYQVESSKTTVEGYDNTHQRDSASARTAATIGKFVGSKESSDSAGVPAASTLTGAQLTRAQAKIDNDTTVYKKKFSQASDAEIKAFLIKEYIGSTDKKTQQALQILQPKVEAQSDSVDLSRQAVAAVDNLSTQSDVASVDMKNEAEPKTDVSAKVEKNESGQTIRSVGVKISASAAAQNDTTSVQVVDGSLKVTRVKINQIEIDRLSQEIEKLALEKGNLLVNDEVFHAQKGGHTDYFGHVLSDANDNQKRMNDLPTANFEMTRNLVLEVKAQLTSLAKMSRSLRSSSEKANEYKREIAEKLIETKLGHVFGFDRFSAKQSVLKLSKTLHDDLVDKIMNDPNLFADGKSDLERAAIIAHYGDDVLNETANGIAKFRTEINSVTGQYTSIISNNGVSSISVINANGKRIVNKYSIRESELGSTDGIVFQTMIVDGKPQTSMTKSGYESVILTPEDGNRVAQSQDAFNATVGAKMMLKATIYSAAKVIPVLAYCILTAPVTPHAFVLNVAFEMAKASGLGLFKVYSMMPNKKINFKLTDGSMSDNALQKLGYRKNNEGQYALTIGGGDEKFSDPAMEHATARITASLGDSRGWMSGSNNRVFTKGSLASKILSGDLNEQIDPTETYYTWGDIATQASKSIFGEGKLTGGVLGSASVALGSAGIAAANVGMAGYKGFKRTVASNAKKSVKIVPVNDSGALTVASSGVGNVEPAGYSNVSGTNIA